MAADGFDDLKYNKPALSGDVGVGLLTVELALSRLARIAHALADKAEIDVSDELNEINEMTANLRASFEALTGWQPE